MSNERVAPVHPDEVLLEEFLKPLGISPDTSGLRILVCRPGASMRLSMANAV